MAIPSTLSGLWEFVPRSPLDYFVSKSLTQLPKLRNRKIPLEAPKTLSQVPIDFLVVKITKMSVGISGWRLSDLNCLFSFCILTIKDDSLEIKNQTTFGNVTRFGIQVGVSNPEDKSCEVSVFMGGDLLSNGKVYLPSFIGGLEIESDRIKKTLNFLKHENLFVDCSLTQIHNAFIHGASSLFANKGEQETVSSFHRFLDLGEPETDVFRAYLIPHFGTLYLTYQVLDVDTGKFGVANVVKGVRDIVPFDITQTLDKLISHLRKR